MNFAFLYDRRRQLFSIGYRLADAGGPGRADSSYYDLLASEARLASFLAIAKGDVPQSHWFHLGRLVVSVAGVPTLVSWGATMFEYLMPLLLMRTYPGTLLDRSCRMVVRKQIRYGRERRVPWGISESAYDLVDRLGNYQYKEFGVPGLGLKRGLADELVVAPYATALAALLEPAEAARNLRRLTGEGAEGPFGYYDAIDYTARGPDEAGDTEAARRRRGVIVKTHLAHHQGMTLVAIANVLLGDVMVDRFHADRRIQATELLLQERIPRQAPVIEPHPAEKTRAEPPALARAPRRLRSPHTPYPRAQILSNGSYVAIVTNGGGGTSFCRDRAVTRWREDGTRDPGSQFVFLRDVHTGAVWSATYQPTAKEPDSYFVEFLAEKATFERLDHDIATRLEVAVSPGDDAEVRRVSLTNRSDRPREIELTSYVELGLGSIAEDVANPAFGKLFVETEWIAENTALLARRRPRGPRDSPLVAFHVLSIPGPTQAQVEWETDRMRFLGRGRGPDDPQGHGRARPVGHDRRGPRPDPESAHPSCGSRPGDSSASRSPPALPPTSRRHATACRSTTTTASPPAPSPWPTRRCRCRCGISAFPSNRPSSPSGSRPASSSPTHRCAATGRPWRGTLSGRTVCGDTASRAISRSSSSA